MRVQIWMPELQIMDGILLYKLDDEERFLSVIKPTLSASIKTYKILPNGYPFLSLIQTFLYLREEPTKAWLLNGSHGLDEKFVWIARNFIRLTEALKQSDDRGAMGAVTQLLTQEKWLHPDQVSFLKFCNQFIKNIIKPMLWGSPLVLKGANPNAKAWWSQPSDLSSSITIVRQELTRCFKGTIPENIQGSFALWLAQITKKIDAHLFVASQKDALYEASALCRQLSAIHFSLGRHTLAVMYCHRATDLLLFSMCASEQLIDFTKNNGGGKLKTPIQEDSSISILNCYNSLVESGRILPDTNREQQFRKLNSMRNLLLYTHYFGSISSLDAKNLLTETFAELEKLAGNAWKTTSQDYLPVLEMQPHEFYALSSGLMGVMVNG